MQPDSPVLTPEDVARRTSRAVGRCLRILMDVRQTDGLYEQVRDSPLLRDGLPEALAAELALWGFEPVPLRPAREPGGG